MLLELLRKQVLNANQEIARRGLAPHTFGNASGIDRAGIDGSGREPLVVIKPSGVDYASLTAADMVVTDLDGKIVEGSLRPSSDLDTHTALYREFPQIGGIVHTHSEFATSWAQAGRAIPCLGTTHADYFHGPVPVTEPLTAEEVAEAYVRNTGAVIVRRFRAENLDPIAVPGVLVAGHAPFAWGKDPAEAVEHADVLEYIARLAFRSVLLGAPDSGIPAVRFRTPLPAQARPQSHLRPELTAQECKQEWFGNRPSFHLLLAANLLCFCRYSFSSPPRFQPKGSPGLHHLCSSRPVTRLSSKAYQ